MENINLVEILKDCPKGTKLYSLIFGEVRFLEIVNDDKHPISVTDKTGTPRNFDVMGKYYHYYNDAECVLFPSKEQRDWSKFTAPWYKKDRFDPNTLKPFDKVLIRDIPEESWCCCLFSHICNDIEHFQYITTTSGYQFCIPYNDDTKHLVGTANEAPEYYRYWEK